MARRFGSRIATPVVWMLGCGCLFSCSAIFGIDAYDRRDESELAGAGGADPGSGGRSTGGRSTGGGASGGRAGTGGEGALGNQPGMAGQTPGGAGGEGGSEERGAILGEPCTGDETQTNTACTIGSPHLVLTCASDVWTVATTCESDQACVPEKSVEEEATCQPISGSCTDTYTNVCRGENVLVDCETFRPESVVRYCPFGCQDGACLPGTGNQLTVHTGTGTGAWFRILTMPVCVLDAKDGDERLVAWIRDEVERTWARTTNYTFEGWEACDPTLPDPGVVISFESGCRRHLANDIDPGSALVRLEICRSFYLEGDEPDAGARAVEEPLARFLGRHHFGHVIGVPDSDYRGEPTTAMVRGIELSRLAEYEISPGEHIAANNYCAPDCRKHPGALVTHRGRCLEVLDGSIVASTCADHDDESGLQDFTLRMSELFTADAVQCVGVSPAGQGTEVLAGECTAVSERFALTGAALRSLGRCVTPASLPAAPGTALWIGACDAVPEAWTAWSFDVTAASENGLLARIRHGDDSAGVALCVSIPGGVAAPNLVPQLRPCDTTGAEQSFELRHDGEIVFGDKCLGWDRVDGSVYLSTECGRAFSDRWTVTGALTTPSGLALTLADGDYSAAATPLDGTPSEAQTFDFYF